MSIERASWENSALCRVYVDLDGVCADFATPASQLLNKPIENSPTGDTWTPIGETEWLEMRRQNPQFWRNLPLMPKALKFWSMLLSRVENVWILTAFDGTLWKDVPQDKADWVAKNLNYPTKRVICCRRSEKKQYANLFDRPHILVDDMQKNIKEFNASGGIGIHYHPSRHVDVVASVAAYQDASRLKS